MKNQNDLIMYIVCGVILIAGLVVSFTTKRDPVRPADPAPVPLSEPKWDEAATNPVMSNGLPKGEGTNDRSGDAAGGGAGGTANRGGGGRGGANTPSDMNNPSVGSN